MLDILIDNKTYKYISSIKINDKCYIKYTDGLINYISGFHYENNCIILDKINEKEFIEVKELID